MFKIVYLWLVRLVSLVNYCRDRKNVVYVMSFNNNVDLIERIARVLPKDRQLIVFYTRRDRTLTQRLNAKGIRTIYFRNNLYFVLVTLPILLTARLIFCDNYFPFLGGLILPPKVSVIQLWHADGAVKRFGWGDPKTAQRTRADKRRFQSVYDRFDQFVVASRAMGRVFIKSYHVSKDRIKLLGYPRSDRFFNSAWIQQARRRVYRAMPQLKHRRVILYAPTYREGVTFNPPRNVQRALTADRNAITIVRLHPALRSSFKKLRARIGRSDRLIYFDRIPTADLLTVADTLITDYSSVAFDFSLLPNARSMIFFMFDLKDYEKEPGCQRDFLKWLPNRPVLTTRALASAIVNRSKTNFNKFNQQWNTYNDGKASERFINYYIMPLKRRN